MSDKAGNDELPDHDFLAFRQFMDEFRGESDRAAVVLGAAKLDLLLYQMLQRFFRPSTSKSDELLDGDSPLGTFSAKITIAHRLGLIGDDLCRALHLIRRIRNAFAHETSGVSLENGAHRDRIRELVAPLSANTSFSWLLTRFFGGDTSPRNQFRAVVALISVRLEGAHEHCPLINWTPFGLIPKSFPDDLKADAPAP
jgi:hypothetical protein